MYINTLKRIFRLLKSCQTCVSRAQSAKIFHGSISPNLSKKHFELNFK